MRELAISIYLFGFNLLFCLFKLLPLKNKATFVVSFTENPMYIYEQMKRDQIKARPVFLCHPRCYETFKETGEAAYLFESKNIGHTLKGIYHLATSNRIIVDNYYGFLANVKFKKSVQCVQIWHAAGAIKQFGIKDPSNSTRSPEALSRFKKVYKKFDRIVVGSDFMASIFEEAFLAPKEVFLKTGVPRTDFFFQEERVQKVRDALYEMNPTLKDKKVILYAPTFRKDEASVTEIALDMAKMYEALKDEYVLMLRLHPKVTSQTNFSELYPGFVFDYGSYPTVNDLLVVTDVLISDYSSIPMEFSLLKRKMVFYAYDLEEYQKASGFWEDYLKVMPGPVVKTTDGVIEAILHGNLEVEKLQKFEEKWNEYSRGNSSELLIEELLLIDKE